MPIKFLVWGDFVFLGGGVKCQFYFHGRGVFSLNKA